MRHIVQRMLVSGGMILAGHLGSGLLSAEESRMSLAESAGNPFPAVSYTDTQFNGYSAHRAMPDNGAPGSAAGGFRHFVLPLERYTHWYRPRAASLTSQQRCAPDTFRPRGFGHLFARPCDSLRMEYSPFLLPEGSSHYGPAYLSRQTDPECEHCDHSGSSRHGRVFSECQHPGH